MRFSLVVVLVVRSEEKKKPVWQGGYCGLTSERVWVGACGRSAASAQLCEQKKNFRIGLGFMV